MLDEAALLIEYGECPAQHRKHLSQSDPRERPTAVFDCQSHLLKFLNLNLLQIAPLNDLEDLLLL